MREVREYVIAGTLQCVHLSLKPYQRETLLQLSFFSGSLFFLKAVLYTMIFTTKMARAIQETIVGTGKISRKPRMATIGIKKIDPISIRETIGWIVFGAISKPPFEWIVFKNHLDSQ